MMIWYDGYIKTIFNHSTKKFGILHWQCDCGRVPLGTKFYQQAIVKTGGGLPNTLRVVFFRFICSRTAINAYFSNEYTFIGQKGTWVQAVKNKNTKHNNNQQNIRYNNNSQDISNDLNSNHGNINTTNNKTRRVIVKTH